jgi:hypothetical protein
MVTVAGSSRVAILRIPGVPPVFPLCDNSGIANQNSVSICENELSGCPIRNIVKPGKIEYGLHWVMVTNEHGCSDRDSVNIISQYDLDVNNTLIYPNPVQEILNVVVELEAEKHVVLDFYSSLGKLIFREDLKQIQFVDKDINVTVLASGPYFVRITIDQKRYTYKVVVIK